MSEQRIALFIDGSNAFASAKALKTEIDYKALLEHFKKQGHLVRAYYYTSVLEDEYSSIKPLIDWLDYNGFTLVKKPAKQWVQDDGTTKTKGNMDIEIAVGMMKMASKIDHAVLLTGDGDFASVVEAVQDEGVRVSVLSTMKTKPNMIADELRRQADDFIELADLPKVLKKR